MKEFLNNLNQHSELIKQSVTQAKAEIVVLNRFVYKIQTVFAHDKCIKIFKLIRKTSNKFLDVDLCEIIKNLYEQHGSCATEKSMYVAPRPRMEYALVRW